MRADNFRIIVEDLIRIVVLPLRIGIHTECEIIEGDVGHALKLRSNGHDSQSVRPGYEPQRRERLPDAPYRLTRKSREAHEVKAKFVHGAGASGRNVAQIYHLRSADVQNLEPRKRRIAIRTLLIKVIDEIVRREQAEAAVPVDSNPALIVPKNIVI